MRQTVSEPDRPERAAFMAELQRWIENAHYCPHGCDRCDSLDIHSLVRAVTALWRQGMLVSELGPACGALIFAIFHFEYSWWQRIVARLWIFVLQRVYRGRPLWNDYWMCLWQLSRDPRYIGKLWNHLKHGSPLQKGTGEWMVASVSAQDAEFGEHWSDLCRERGPVFDGDLMSMIHNGGAL